MTSSRDTIFALSSGRPPAAIAVIRISGPRAGVALEALTGRIPAPRKGVLGRIRVPTLIVTAVPVEFGKLRFEAASVR